MAEIHFDDETTTLFINKIRKIIQDEINEALKNRNIEEFVDLSVASISEDFLTATLKDLSTGEFYENIPNHTNIKLEKGDIVRMYIANQTYNNQYIGQVFGRNFNYLCNREEDS